MYPYQKSISSAQTPQQKLGISSSSIASTHLCPTFQILLGQKEHIIKVCDKVGKVSVLINVHRTFHRFNSLTVNVNLEVD